MYKRQIQRVTSAAVHVNDQPVGAIDRGLLVLLGIGPEDGRAELEWLTSKLVGLRIFSDSDDKMNLSVLDIDGGILVVSQFTLYGDCRKGRRPSFVGAAHPSIAEPLYEAFCERLRQLSVRTVETGKFGASMRVSLVNDGPVTLILER